MINLALMGACIGALVIGLILYPLLFAPPAAPSAPPTKTLRPTFTPSPSATLTLTPTASFTPAPTRTLAYTLTPSRTPTAPNTPPPPGLPTLTPARAAVLASAYTLRPWNAEQADTMARLLSGYPNTLGLSAQNNRAYALAYRFPILAWKEALLRFPNAPQATSWRWGLAYDLAQAGSIEAGEQYAILLAQALNQDETDIPALYDWFRQREPRLALFMTQIDPPDGYLGSYVVELRGQGGSAFIWLRQAPSGYQATPLYTRFDVPAQLTANWLVADLDNNPLNGEEIAISFSNRADQFSVDPPLVFNLSQVPARPMPFYPQSKIFNLGLEYENRWVARLAPTGGSQLVFSASVFPACPVRVEHTYTWNGNTFTELQRSYTFEIADLGELPAETLAACQVIAQHAALAWGPQAAIALMEPLTPWLGEAQTVLDPSTPAADLDAWRHQLGVLSALAGDDKAARDHFNQVITHPSVADSPWAASAQEFLRIYQSPGDIYRACIATPTCDAAEAIRLLVRQTPAAQNAFVTLTQGGLNPNASGYFDFDGDGERERWFTTRHRPRQLSEFWILARAASGWAALRVDTVEAIPPQLETLDEAYIAEEGLTLQPAAFLENRLAFTMRRAPVSQQPYLVQVPLRKEYPNKFFLPLAALERGLFLGHDPKGIKQDLQNLQDYPGLLCAPTWTCDSYYYLLGLAAELSGDEKAAVAAYHKLWQDYSRSPFTVMARLKLEGSGFSHTATPTPSATPGAPTITGTPTIGPSLTPTFTGTPPTATPGTPTITGTPPTATPGTPTVTGTPPTATPGTPTVTGTPPTATPGTPYPVDTTTPYPN